MVIAGGGVAALEAALAFSEYRVDGLAVELVVNIPELPREQAEALVRAAHEVCPYSNATRGNIVVDIRLA